MYCQKIVARAHSTENYFQLRNLIVSTNNIIYSEYLGDGDTSSFTEWET